jgi:hypothetical protein
VTIGGHTYAGGVVAGGALAIWGGATTSGGDPALIVAVRSATSSTEGTFQGDYWIVRLARNHVTGGYSSLAGSLTADGVGGFALEGEANNEGTPGSGSLTGSYVVDPDGTATLYLVQPLPGGISQDGRFVVLGGAEAIVAYPTIALLVRK